MKKLNQRKIRWIIRELKKKELSICSIAKLQKITPRWVRELHKRYLTTGELPFPRKPGRKPKPITEEERRAVLEMRSKHPLCAVTLEKLLMQEGIKISHNRIHRILKEVGLGEPEVKKQKRRFTFYFQRYFWIIISTLVDRQQQNYSISSGSHFIQ